MLGARNGGPARGCPLVGGHIVGLGAPTALRAFCSRNSLSSFAASGPSRRRRAASCSESPARPATRHDLLAGHAFSGQFTCSVLISKKRRVTDQVNVRRVLTGGLI